jgi:S-adenosylmethionine:tRNA ribosyltransferase-isomerase
MIDIDINEYDYDLPSDRIAQYPVSERDSSQLLISDGEKISKDIFRNIDNYIPSGSMLVFNNTRVIRARLHFRKDTGASIEILCLEPLSPVEYEMSFSSLEQVEWKCIIGNLKKWKNGTLIISFSFSGKKFELIAEKLEMEGEFCRVRFTWTNKTMSFGEVIEATGHIPLPPYINREDNSDDITRYQTIYSRIKGSVAAPTAGLHFSNIVLDKIIKKGVKSAEVTLHVGAGTFQPIKSNNIKNHEMHCEHFHLTADTIKLLLENHGNLIPVGTTSVRTLESLYWLGVKMIQYPLSTNGELTLNQWEAYSTETKISVKDALEALLKYLKEEKQSILQASTSIIIVPGYNFRMINGMITNFHQPRSTLLLLISAWSGKRWKKIYNFALENNFRFLSYGDSSLLLRNI